MSDPILSVIIPAYNEAATVVSVLEAVIAAAYVKQVIVVNDGSTDGTGDILATWNGREGAGYRVEVVHHPMNRGKGAAIRTGVARACGQVVLVQDADLEYDPIDYPALVEPILAREADVVYGSRYLRQDPASPLPWTPNRACVVLLNLMVRVLYGQRITDEATCYKALRVEVIRALDLRCERFEFCPEVTAKVSRMGLKISERPIHYRPRSYSEGKKIGWRDGIEAIATLLRWRFAPPPLIVSAAGP